MWSKWFLIDKNKPNPRIRRGRRENGKVIWQRYPAEKMRNIKREDLPAFVMRLNGETEAKRLRAAEAYKIKHAFITQDVLDEYDQYLMQVSSSKKAAQTARYLTHKLFLHFFINVLKLNDPVDWKRQELTWGAALLNLPEKKAHKLFEDDEPRSKQSVRHAAQAANKFLTWLHERNPGLFQPIKLVPVSRPVLKLHEQRRKLQQAEGEVGNFISDEDWATIEGALPSNIKPFIQLAYYFGLRRAEAGAITILDVRKGYLAVSRQLVAAEQFEPTKNRLNRRVPYWFISPAETHDIVNSLPRRLHPDVLSANFIALMDKLKFPYRLHDLRRTFITKALRQRAAVDVQRAAGHASIDTTMRYLMDDRALDDEVYKPT